MPFGNVQLVPGVNTERTPTLLQAQISQSQLIRFKDSLVQKLGGWTSFFNAVSGVPRDMHAWQDLNTVNHLNVGTTTQLNVITTGSGNDVTPQTKVTTLAPVNIVQKGNTFAVEITDASITNVTINDVVVFNTPVILFDCILFGAYQITSITSAHVYRITQAQRQSSIDVTGTVPTFTTVNGSVIVTVTFTGVSVVTTAQVGGTAVFSVSTTGNGVTIFGDYTVLTSSGNTFTIAAAQAANASSTFSMNSGNAQLTYYLCIDASGTGQTGTKITATDWTSDNWGEILLTAPTGGGIYQFDPTSGNQTACLIPTAPQFNGGIFVSQSQEILVSWASTPFVTIPGPVAVGQPTSPLNIPRQFIFGAAQDPLLVRWSTVGDFTNFQPTAIDQASSFRIPTGSHCVAGAAVSNQNLIWTDLDLWAMNYVGPPFVFGFNKIGAGAGAVSSHAVQQLRGNVYWMGSDNFFSLSSGGAAVIPCPVWDFVFQNNNTTSMGNVRSMPNTLFNEAGWLFPSAASGSGECDSYVKMNITEPSGPWDYGTIDRTAFIDQSVLGAPIGANHSGVVFQHETSPDAAGGALSASFTTNYFMIAEGEDFAFVDQIIPDMKWGTYPGTGAAQVQLTFNVIDFPGDTVTSFGPYTVTQTTEYIDTHFRGRQMSVTVASTDVGSFWRLGRIRYRWGPAGRR